MSTILAAIDTIAAASRCSIMPLDGTPDAARAVEQAMRWFAGSGVAILSLHVVDAATVPRF